MTAADWRSRSMIMYTADKFSSLQTRQRPSPTIQATMRQYKRDRDRQRPRGQCGADVQASLRIRSPKRSRRRTTWALPVTVYWIAINYAVTRTTPLRSRGSMRPYRFGSAKHKGGIALVKRGDRESIVGFLEILKNRFVRWRLALVRSLRPTASPIPIWNSRSSICSGRRTGTGKRNGPMAGGCFRRQATTSVSGLCRQRTAAGDAEAGVTNLRTYVASAGQGWQ